MLIDPDHEERRHDLLCELEIEEPERWVPGSFGCHELLDRIHIVGNQFESIIVRHPSCVLKPEWFSAACQILDQMEELYQKVGAEH